MSGNRSLKSINITKTEVNDKVCVHIGTYIKHQGLILKDLNISRNLISTDGLIALSLALKYNISIISLNLSQNYIKEGGIEELVIALNTNRILKELCLSTNKINNSGLSTLSGFLPVNSTLRVFDISKNNYEFLRKCATTALGSKVVSKCQDHFADLAVKAVLHVADIERRDVNFDLIKIIAKAGGAIEDSHFIEGIVIDKDFSHP